MIGFGLCEIIIQLKIVIDVQGNTAKTLKLLAGEVNTNILLGNYVST